MLEHREDYDTAVRGFAWPELTRFNWALDWFDVVARDPANAQRHALWIVEEDGTENRWTYPELAARSDRVANWLRRLGVARGDRLILMLGNQGELWETILAAIKLGAVLIPASTLLGPDDLADRVDRGRARHVVVRSADAPKFDGIEGGYTRIAVGEPVAGWHSYATAQAEPAEFTPDGDTAADDPLLLYFTSGTTAKPKLVQHTHVSYPVGHLSTLYWIGLEPGDVHLNISSPGWAKHAWSNVFAPWNAEATVFLYNYQRFDAPALMGQMDRCGVTSFCAPPTVWRMLIQADLSLLRTPPRKVVGAGEPLNPEVIEQVERHWGRTVRDGFGQTESSVQIANTPGQEVVPGSMGRPLPGFAVALVDPVTGERAAEGEICLDLAHRPVGLMAGYAGDDERTSSAFAGGYYHTGDVGSVDERGYITYVGRTDDVFKASDYRISPFELESVLLEHEAVAEAAVVPAPDPIRLAVPKAYVVLADGHEPTAETAKAVLAYAREHLAPYKRIRRLEFAHLPKTISGKIRRVELRGREHAGPRPEGEFREEDFPDLKS
ncbi:AMP-binding protein [Amycolatopsis sp. PS_44_ISF1]|nr:AMP-binding protein [Amycolatopsis sp. PS_44_ISF1]